MKKHLSSLWIMATLSLLTSQLTMAQSADVKAIKAVIEGETQAWLNVDQKAYANAWANVPEARLHYSEPNGKVHEIDMSGDKASRFANQKPSNAKFQNTNYKIRVNGNAAFAQFDQVFSDTDGTTDHARETRYLEKMGGQWKIVHVGAMYYAPETPANVPDKGILAANQVFMRAFEQGATALGDLYTTDAQLFPPNGDVIRGNKAIGPFWKGAFDMGIKKATLETTETERVGDQIVETGRYSLAGADGKAIDKGKYIVVWKNDNGQWKLYRDIWNTSQAPAK